MHVYNQHSTCINRYYLSYSNNTTRGSLPIIFNKTKLAKLKEEKNQAAKQKIASHYSGVA